MVVQYEDSSIGDLPFDAEMLVLEQGGTFACLILTF